ncbi:MAG: MFS transporter [Candidatus Lokiarchaeota archaeon]|nr:MFS transporter [Candidatus Lokiarchaeota archaeon]
MSAKEQSNGLSTKKKRLIFGVSIPVFLMGLVSLFTDISSESIQSILPLFIFEIGGSVLALGIISGITNAIANILKGITGWMSDKINRRKPFIVAGYSLSNLSKPLIGLSPSWEMVLGLKTTDRIGKGLRTSSRDALISYYAEKKGRAFGLHRAMDTLGAVFGSLLAFILLYFAWTYSQIIFFSIVPGLIAIALILPVKDISSRELVKKSEGKSKKERMEKIDKNFVKLIVILGVIEFASLDVVFLILRAADYIPLDLIYLIPIFYLILNLVYTIFSPINGSLSDKVGRKPIIVVGLLILLVSCVILAFPIQVSPFSIVLIIIIYIMHGFYLASVDPISRAYIADLAGKEKRGRAYGYYYFSVGFISMVEALVFGYIYSVFSYTWAFIYISILLAVCIVIFTITDFSKIIKKAEK